MLLALGLLQIIFMVICALCVLFRTFIMKECWDLSKAFSVPDCAEFLVSLNHCLHSKLSFFLEFVLVTFPIAVKGHQGQGNIEEGISLGAFLKFQKVRL